MAKAQVYVTYKNGVLEPQGLAVQRVLSSLGFHEVKKVRVGKFIEIELDSAEGVDLFQRLQDMSRGVLANPVIEDFRVELSE